MLFALLELAIAALADIAWRETKLTLKQRRKVVTVAETALISDIRDAFFAVTQQVAGAHQTQPIQITLRR